MLHHPVRIAAPEVLDYYYMVVHVEPVTSRQLKGIGVVHICLDEFCKLLVLPVEPEALLYLRFPGCFLPLWAVLVRFRSGCICPLRRQFGIPRLVYELDPRADCQEQQKHDADGLHGGNIRVALGTFSFHPCLERFRVALNLVPHRLHLTGEFHHTSGEGIQLQSAAGALVSKI